MNRQRQLSAIEKYSFRPSKERLHPGKYRTQFMRDRDRILYSKPFRRLSRKTQIFLPSSDDHVRTRLTHSLEVSQIATITAEALGLDRDLTEAIALGHDIGHTPFGHSGERALNFILSGCDPLGGLNPIIEKDEKGFKHNLQGIRLTIDLTNLYRDMPGLNLTNFTLWGIKNHTGTKWKNCEYRNFIDEKTCACSYPQRGSKKTCIFQESLEFDNAFYCTYDKYLLCKKSDNMAWSFEGFLVKIADEIAQRHHDIEDGIIAKLIDIKTIIDILEELLLPYFNSHEKRFFKKLKEEDNEYFTQNVSRLIIGCLNRNLIENTRINFRAFRKEFSINKRKDFTEIYPSLSPETEFDGPNGITKIKDIVSYPLPLKTDDEILKKDHLSKLILNSYEAQRMDGKARFIIRQLAKAYLSNPQQLPNTFINKLFDGCHPDKTIIRNVTIGDKRNWLKSMYSDPSSLYIAKFLIRIIGDFISGMTDDFALREHARLYSTGENIDIRHY